MSELPLFIVRSVFEFSRSPFREFGKGQHIIQHFPLSCGVGTELYIDLFQLFHEPIRFGRPVGHRHTFPKKPDLLGFEVIEIGQNTTLAPVEVANLTVSPLGGFP